MNTSLPHPDHLHLRASVGWLELGNAIESQAEFDKIRLEFRMHPEVLKVRWQISIRMKDWNTAKEVSSTLTGLLPLEPDAWRIHANSFYFAGEYQAAYDIAKPKVDEFKRDWQLHYDLACYCCRLARVPEGERCLKKAMNLGDAEEVKRLALADVDLQPLWHLLNKPGRTP